MDLNEDDWIDLYISIQEITYDVLNDNLHLLSKSEMCKEITNEIYRRILRIHNKHLYTNTR